MSTWASVEQQAFSAPSVVLRVDHIHLLFVRWRTADVGVSAVASPVPSLVNDGRRQLRAAPSGGGDSGTAVTRAPDNGIVATGAGASATTIADGREGQAGLGEWPQPHGGATRSMSAALMAMVLYASVSYGCFHFAALGVVGLQAVELFLPRSCGESAT